ncbi:MAG: hypothetical protein M1835_007788 [Candelina submexicana]|nr:MAG: hypothetical protein M1835_007788 [Candelina submexicana]
MTFSRSRTIAVIVSALAVLYNTISSYLFYRLPDDPYHIATNLCAYSHFATILSTIGLIGATRQHAFSVAVFANYLIIDTILCSIPRFLIMSLLSATSRDALCTPESPLSFRPNPHTLSLLSRPSTTSNRLGAYHQGAYQEAVMWVAWPDLGWSKQQCLDIVWMLQCAVCMGIVATTLVQFVCALSVREYGNKLYERDQLKSGVGKAEKAIIVVTDLEKR